MSEITVRSEVCRFINYAMQQNYVPAVYSITVTNHGELEAQGMTLRVSAQPQFAFPLEAALPTIGAGQSYELRPVDFKVSAEFMLTLTEKIAAYLTVEVWKDGELYASDRINVDLLAYDQWNGTAYMPEMLGAFVMPNSPASKRITARAGEILNDWTGDPSFTGYQTCNPNNVRIQAAAIYAALQEMNIAYRGAPPSFEATGQRIRIDAADEKTGTCIDLALLYAGCLEAVSINPVIVLFETHAFVGVWLEDSSFPECVTDDASALIKRSADGISELCFVECTDFTAGRNVSFEQAEKDAENLLVNSENFELAVDVKRCRNGGIRPLPIRIKDGDGKIIADYGSKKPEELSRMPGSIDLDAASADQNVTEPVTKRQVWERKLLDLSLRNPLLNFRGNKSSVQLMTDDLNTLEDRLSSGESFTLCPRPEDWTDTPKDSNAFSRENNRSVAAALAESEFKSKRIRSFLAPSELEKSCKKLYLASRTSLAESGSNTLYLALGFLRWYESDRSEKPRYAPLVLVPVDIVRNVQQRSFKIRIRDEETQMNITLLELLRQDFGIDIKGLDPVPSDESGVNLKLVFNTVRRAVMAQKRWDIESCCFLGLFSFSRFIMWNDLRNRSTDIEANKVVRSLISGKLEWQSSDELLQPEQLDRMLAPSDIAAPLSADSSQLAAIAAASAEESFVLHGPPGTGKSQTITNMIANALYHGKSVLFVAEKMAALSVVQSRLEKIGIGAFCLELHSNKAQKRAVLSQLERVLNVGSIKEQCQYEAAAQKLCEQRAELNGVMEALHKQRGFGFSLYQAITLYESNKGNGAVPKLTLDKEFIGSLSHEGCENTLQAVERLQSAAEAVGSVSGNVLSGYGRRDYSVAVKAEIASELVQGEIILRSYRRSLEDFCGQLGICLDDSRAFCGSINGLCGFICGSAPVLQGVLDGSLDEKDIAGCYELIEAGRRLSELTCDLEAVFEPTVFDIDVCAERQEWKKACASWALPRAIGKSRLVKRLRLHARNGQTANSITAESYPEHIGKLAERAGLSKVVSEPEQKYLAALKELWQGEGSDWSALKQTLDDNLKLRVILSQLKTVQSVSLSDAVTESRQNGHKSSAAADELSVKYKSFTEFNEDFCSKYQAVQSEDGWLSVCETQYTGWQGCVDKLKDWSAFLREEDSASALGLKSVCAALRSGRVLPQELSREYKCSLGYTAALEIISCEPELSQFVGRSFEEKIAAFKAANEQFRSLTVSELAARLSARVPFSGERMADSSEIGILQKAIRNGARMLPLRKLFDSIPILLRRICPCMLMSPISVAQYIDPSFPKFDLVIFDEASQLPTCEAVGAIARGNNVVVVGDPKQLPPTSFFNVNHFDEENPDKEDLESVLDDCLALSMPQRHLLWHYRSRHESLIAYSNARFYDNKLYTFPSPNDLESRVTLVKVDGCYDKGGSKQNAEEAKAVVDEIVRRLDDEKLRSESIGVVTFNIVQQSLIDDMLADRFRERPELEKLADEMYEPILVKNLENVQGDERDVILFSIGYGPDRNGKVSMNFGPINRDGGWRRLNVAISRSRKQMIVFSSITYDMIDLSRTSAEGVAGLKGFLEFAQRGRESLALTAHPAAAGSEADSMMRFGINNRLGIERLIADKLNRAGYRTRCNIGCSEYKLDIGVVDPSDETSYILGIMCDGYSYASTETAYDRNVSQPSVLTGLGWRLMRVWTLDWFDNWQEVLDRIIAEIENAVKAPSLSEQSCETCLQDTSASEKGQEAEGRPSEEPSFEKEGNTLSLSEKNTVVADRSDNADNTYYIDYTKAEIKVIGTPDMLYDPGKSETVMKLMRHIIDVEAPISRKVLFRRTLSAFGMSRSTSKSDLYLSELLSRTGCRITNSNGNAFCWGEWDDHIPEELRTYRSRDGRSIEDYCAEEIAAAVLCVLDKQLTLERDDLIRETARALGFSRATPAVERAVTESIVLCKKRSLINISPDNGKIFLN